MKCDLIEGLSSFLGALLFCAVLVMPATIVGCAEGENAGDTAVDTDTTGATATDTDTATDETIGTEEPTDLDTGADPATP